MSRVQRLATLLMICALGVCGQQYIPQRCNIFKRVPCVCQDERGNYVDLRPLAFINDTARFFQVEQKVPGQDHNFLFSWNPCFGFTEGFDRCTDVAVCRMAYDLNYYEDIGRQYTAEFSHFDNGNLSIEYTSKENTSVTIVSLYCDEKQDAIFRVNPAFFREDGRDTYWLQLWSTHSCPKKSLIETEKRKLDIPTKTAPVATTEITMTSKLGPDLKRANTLLSSILLVTALIFAVMLSMIIYKMESYKQEVDFKEYNILSTFDDDVTKLDVK